MEVEHVDVDSLAARQGNHTREVARRVLRPHDHQREDREDSNEKYEDVVALVRQGLLPWMARANCTRRLHGRLAQVSENYTAVLDGGQMADRFAELGLFLFTLVGWAL